MHVLASVFLTAFKGFGKRNMKIKFAVVSLQDKKNLKKRVTLFAEQPHTLHRDQKRPDFVPMEVSASL
jgi:hypothetical protein